MLETSYVGINDRVDQESFRSRPGGGAPTRCCAFAWTTSSCCNCCRQLPRISVADQHLPKRHGVFFSSMTALTKKDGGVGCIETGTTFGATGGQDLQLVNSAKKWSQHAHLSSSRCPPVPRHVVKGLTDMDARTNDSLQPKRSVRSHKCLSSASAMMNKLLDVKGLRKLLPFARTVYANPVVTTWKKKAKGITFWPRILRGCLA